MNENEELILSFINEELNEIPITVNEKLYFDNNPLNARNELDELKNHIDTFLKQKTPNRFIVLPGLRGVGKSTLLFQLYDYLLKEKNISHNNILYISCDDLYKTLECDIKKTIEIYIKNKFNASLRTLKEKVFIFIDESQYDKDWALSGKIIYDKSYNIFMVFTGSSAIHLEYNADAARRLIKKSINPLNYTQHLKLKYGVDLSDLSYYLKETIFTGNIDNAVKCESQTDNTLTNLLEYNSLDWDNYFKYGGFPVLYGRNSIRETQNELLEITENVITRDMHLIKDLNENNHANANRILRYLAKQQPGELTHANLANYLKTSAANVNNILDLLEKTHLIFHCEPYGGAAKRIKKSWKYYFATSSIRYALAKKIGHPLIDTADYEGILIENLVASNLFNLFNNDDSFTVYYDANEKKNVDFLIQNGLEYPIPIEVGRGEKKKSQIKYAMDKYNAPYGIIVSNNTQRIEKNDDVIYIPVKTFSYL